MANFTNLYDEIMQKIRGVDTPLIDYNIRRVARDFLKATTLWRETIPVTLKQGMVDYRLVPASGGLIAGIRNMPRVDDASRTMAQLPETSQWPDGYVTEAGQPDGYWELYPGTFKINRPPDQDYPILVDVFKQLTLDPEDTFLPDDLVDHYYETLAAGVCARLMSMGAVPWRDTTMATIYNTEYTKAKFAARGKLRNGGSRNNSTVRAPVFAGRRVNVHR